MLTKQFENIIITTYIGFYLIGLGFIYFDLPLISYIFFGLTGLMMYRHIKLTIYLIRRQKNERN